MHAKIVPTLREMQQLFYQMVIAPEGVKQGLAQAGLQIADLERVIKGDPLLPAADRLDIYANMYFYRLLDVLKDDYPSVLKVVGEDAFHNLVTEYLMACPPAHPSLRNTGERLPGFLSTHALSDRWPWLRDLALLERQRVEVFDGVDRTVRTMEELRAWPADHFAELPIRLIPSHALLPVTYPVEDVWQAVEDGEAVPALSTTPATTPATTPGTLLVWRHDLLVCHRRLSPQELEVIDLLIEGALFGRLCDRLMEGRTEQEVIPLAFQLLSDWVTQGLIATQEVHHG